MPTAFTGTLGWTGLHPVQLGGPPLINTYDRKLPPTAPPQVGVESEARPFIGHLYQNDGVTFLGTFPILNRPVLSPILANGGFNQITLEIQAFASGGIWGQFIWGIGIWGGTGLSVSQGNVVRLSEQGGDGSFVYGGVVEDLPETIGAGGVKHQILVTPFASELDDTFSQAVYTAPTDLSQLVRDAVALTRHCSCDQVSCPVFMGISVATSGALDFRNQTVKSIIDNARSIAGPTWYWHVDELGRVWFQPMGSGAVYTIPRGQFEERTSSASIKDRKNKVVAVGGVPPGGTLNITAVADDLASQASIGIRALNPPLQIPNISDQPTLTLIAQNILTVLNRTWQRANLKVLPTYGRRIHASQPGGAMIRTFEPSVNPMQESSAGSGYSGIFVAQSLNNDGLRQDLTAGDIPAISQIDIQNMVNSLVARSAANSLQVTAAALNLQRQVVTGSFQSGPGTLNVSGNPTSVWQLNQDEFALWDANGIDRVAMGNLSAAGVSPAGFLFRAKDANGNPIFDSLGLIAAASILATELLASATSSGSGTGWSTVQTIPGSGANFSLSRAGNIMCSAVLSTVMTAGTQNYMALYHAIWTQAGALVQRKQIGASQFDQNVQHFHNPTSFFFPLAAGSYQFRQEFALDAGTTSCGFGVGATAIVPQASIIQLGA